MSKLISANFSRLFKSGIFRLYMIFCGGLSLFLIIIRHMEYINHKEMYDQFEPTFKYIDDAAFLGLLYLIFAVPVFTGSFVGREYSDGTIRNKLIIGHKRNSIYLANLIVCTAGTLIGVLLNLLINFTVGAAVCGMKLTLKEILKTTLLCMAAFTALTAVMILISMIVKSKSGASVAVLALTMIMFISSAILNNKLSEPEYYEAEKYFDVDTQQLVDMPRTKNLHYLTGTKRKVYQTVYDTMPTSHIYEYTTGFTEKSDKYLVYESIVLIVATATGTIIFRRKDLK